MSTPVQVTLAYARALLVVFLCMAATAAAVSRTYVFYESYSQFTLQRSEEAWLRERCKVRTVSATLAVH